VCGLRQEESPWGDDGKTPSFNICDCCGVEFGYEDNNLEAVKSYRKSWLQDGAKWFNSKAKPFDWNLKKQTKDIPSDFK